MIDLQTAMFMALLMFLGGLVLGVAVALEIQHPAARRYWISRFDNDARAPEYSHQTRRESARSTWQVAMVAVAIRLIEIVERPPKPPRPPRRLRSRHEAASIEAAADVPTG